MKLTFKNLKQQTFALEVDTSITVAQMKEQIEREKGEEYYAAGLKIIFSGKILNDAQTVAEYNIKETDFLVVMAGKPRPQPVAPAAAPVAAAPFAAPSTPAAPAAAPAQAAPAPAPAPAAPSFPEAVITSLTEMGFPRDQAIAALRAANGNPDAAIDFLMGGGVGGDFEADFEDEGEDGGDFEGDDGVPAELSADSPLRVLAENPQFNQLRALIQQHPEMLPAILQQFAQTNPALIQLINENRADFQALLNTPVQAPAAAGQQGGHQGGQIRVTQEEHQAIERLCAMGFDRNMVIQAYFACDKNEELTANYLLEHGFE